MSQKILIVKHYGNTDVKLLETWDDNDLVSTIDKAAKEAEKDGIVFETANIPEKYLEKQGIKIIPCDIVEIENRGYGMTEAQKNGIEAYATCKDCDSFEYGSCYRYGGICNPDDEQDCIHSCNTFEMCYDGNENDRLRTFIILDDDVKDRLSDDPHDPLLPWILEHVCNDNEFVRQKVDELKAGTDYDPENWKIRAKQFA